MEIRTIDAFTRYYESIRGRTRRVLDAVPPDLIERSWREGKWTIGDLVRHLAASERWMFAENVARRPSRYDGCGRDLADGHEAVLAYFERMHEESMAIFTGLGDARLDEACRTPGGAEIRVWKWLRAMIEHEIHHRGQIYLLLSMQGVETPPLYGLTSEQVRERSVGGSES